MLKKPVFQCSVSRSLLNSESLVSTLFALTCFALVDASQFIVRSVEPHAQRYVHGLITFIIAHGLRAI